MPISTKTKTSLITPDFAKQIENNMKAEQVTDTVQTVSQTSIPSTPVETAPAAEKKGKYSDVVNLHLTTGKRAEFRAFFSAHEVSLVQGVETAVNFIMKEVNAGNLKISRNGIEKVGM